MTRNARKSGEAVDSELAAEARRIEAVRAAGRVPEGCGDAIPDAPARGPVQRFQPHVLLPDGKGGEKVVRLGYRDRHALRRLDVFDAMAAQARRAKAKLPLTVAQVEAGRTYALVAERVAASGLKLSSMEGGGGTGGGDVAEARLADADRLRRMQGRIGTGLAMELRRVRPSKRGESGKARRNVSDRQLVDAVCLGGMTPAAVLREAGWTVDSHHRKLAMAALARVLDALYAL